MESLQLLTKCAQFTQKEKKKKEQKKEQKRTKQKKKKKEQKKNKKKTKTNILASYLSYNDIPGQKILISFEMITAILMLFHFNLLCHIYYSIGPNKVFHQEKRFMFRVLSKPKIGVSWVRQITLHANLLYYDILYTTHFFHQITRQLTCISLKEHWTSITSIFLYLVL